MPRVSAIAALAKFGESGARLVSWRTRLDPSKVLVRIEMPTPEAAAWARELVAGAGLAVGGNDTPWETQLVFTVPTHILDEMYAGWRQTSMPNHGEGRSLGPAPRALGPGV